MEKSATCSSPQPVRRGSRVFELLYSPLVLSIPWVHAALIRLLLPDVDEQVERFGSELHINKREEAGYWRAHRLARSSPFLWREMGALISLALILQDVGANVGLFSSCLVRFRKLQPAVRFYAFEANRDTAIMLAQSVPAEEVLVAGMAVSDRDGPLAFVHPPGNSH